ncbi:MAG: Nif3-like dinuclear metal center hexameric protein [Bacteriovoracaceae bacterium]|nr:Nif3-like dinuclear metal center hexameric protein [Bacteriovoracaceae bacterium]
MNRADLAKYFEELLKPHLFEDYAPNGLQIEGQKTVKKVAFSVSATQDSIHEALKWGADTLVVHHGVLWRHQGARPLTGAWGERVKLAIKSDLNLFAYHLPLDSHEEVGNAVSLAYRIGMKELSPFAAYKRQFLGSQGKLLVPMKAKDFAKHLEKILNHPVVMACENDEKLISSLGIVTGGANNEWSEALKAGLDAFLTGEISEYNWHDAREAGIAYFAGGHHATEKFGPQSLMERLRKDHSQLEVKFFDSQNPA